MTKRDKGAAGGRGREKERKKDDREVKRGTNTGQQGYDEDRVGSGVEGERAGRRKGRSAVVSLRLWGRKEGEE